MLVRVPPGDLSERSVRFQNLMGSVGTVGFERERRDLDAHGLYLDMPAWGLHVFDVSAPAVARAAVARVSPRVVASRVLAPGKAVPARPDYIRTGTKRSSLACHP